MLHNNVYSGNSIKLVAFTLFLSTWQFYNKPASAPSDVIVWDCACVNGGGCASYTICKG